VREERSLRETGFAFLEGLVESCDPRDEMGALVFGRGEDVMERCFKRSGVGQVATVKISHSQEPSELADGLGRRTSLKVGNPFWKGLGSRR